MKYCFLFILFVIINCDITNIDSDNDTSINIPLNNTNVNKSASYIDEEILKHYAYYTTLEEYQNDTCYLEPQIEAYTEDVITKRIKDSGCIPDSKSLSAILELGWEKLAEYLVKDVYLANMIDPSSIMYSYLYKNEGKIKYLRNLIVDVTKMDKLDLTYSFENYDNVVKFYGKLPDASYSVEYFSVFCYKDMLQIHAIFKARNKIYRLKDSRTLYDEMENECEYNYNSFDAQFEFSLNKVKQMKKWEKLFK